MQSVRTKLPGFNQWYVYYVQQFELWMLGIFEFMLTAFIIIFYLALSEPVDVYSEWVDACEAVAKRLANGEHPDQDGENNLGEGDDGEVEGDYEEEAASSRSKPKPSRSRRAAALSDEDDDDDLF